MRISPRVIDKISEEIANRLEDGNHVEYTVGMKEEIIRSIRELIFEDIKREDDLDEEVREVIEKNIDKFKDIPPHRMFSHIKRQLVRERGIII